MAYLLSGGYVLLADGDPLLLSGSFRGAGLMYIKLTDKLACQGPSTFTYVLRSKDLVSANDTMAIEDQESLSFTYPRIRKDGTVRPITAQMRAGRVLTVVWDNGDFEEWRVGPVIRGRGNRGLVAVEGVPIWLDLIERSDLVSEVRDGEPIFAFEVAGKSGSDILADFVIANGPSHITLGTVEPTAIIPAVSVDHQTRWEMAKAVRDAYREMDIPCELRLRRNGTTDYKLDLVTQIGSAADTPVFHPRASLVSLTQRTDPTLQMTRAMMRGGTDPDGFPGKGGRARWRGAAPVGNIIALTDRNGGASPIAFDNQWVTRYNVDGTTTQGYLLRVKTGGTFAITASSAAAGGVTVGGGVSTIADDEDFEFRWGEPLTNTRTTTLRYAISAVGGGTITCAVSNPIAVNDQYVDWYARIWSALSGGTIILDHTKVSTTVAATDVITPGSIVGVTTAHFVEFIQLDGAGEVPVHVEHPTYIQADPTGYGVKVGQISRPNNFGIVQLARNPWAEIFTNPANPPDFWTKVGVVPTAQETTITRLGGKSWKFTYAGDAGGGNFQMWGEKIYPNWDPGHTRLSSRAWVYFTLYGNSGTDDGSSSLSLYALTATGALGALLGSFTTVPEGVRTTVGPSPFFIPAYVGTYVPQDAWIEYKVEGITLGPDAAPYGIVGVFRPNHIDNSPIGSPTFTGYVDTIEYYPFQTCPSASYKHGDSSLLIQAGNRHLADFAPPPAFYDMSILDLARAFPGEYPRLLATLGGMARAADIEYGMDPTVRVLSRKRDLKEAAKTIFTLANRSARLTDPRHAGIQLPGDDPGTLLVVSGAAAGVLTPAYSPSPPVQQEFTGTVPSGYQATTPVGTVGVTASPGSAVTYTPTSPTNPTTGVTVALPGAPPRPRVSARQSRTLR